MSQSARFYEKMELGDKPKSPGGSSPSFAEASEGILRGRLAIRSCEVSVLR